MSNISVAVLVVFALFGLSSAYLGYSRPSTGQCLCITASALNIRSGPGTGYRVLGTERRNKCFRYAVGISRVGRHYWYRLNYNGQSGWAAGTYLRYGSSSNCGSQNSGACSNHGGSFNQACLNCICQVESRCRPLGCSWDVNSLSCGYYQIKRDYYTDCYKPGSSWEQCARDKSCASRCVVSYINRYYRTCTGRSSPKCCEQAARMHNGGPYGCRKSATIGYWNKVKACLNGQ